MLSRNDPEVLITAAEGYRALEAAVLSAVSRIDMGFRVFDPRMRLLSDNSRRIGDTWADLLVAKLDAGVRITIRISDFDPIVRPELHRASWKSCAVLAGVRELTQRPENLIVSIDAHPARVGLAPRLALWPKVQSQVSETCATLNDLDPATRREALRCMPRFRPLVEERDGRLQPKRRCCPPMIPVTHHQKVAVIDDAILYIGGLDLDARRMDTPAHRRPSEETWHDVQVILRDPARARAARRHLDRFAAECDGALAPEPPEGLLRTLSVRRKRAGLSLSPIVTDTSILDRHLDLISRSERLIYLESQFLRDPVLARALADRAAAAPELGVICLLPAAPQEVAFDGADGRDQRYGEYLQARCLAQLSEAYGARIFFCSPAQCDDAEADDRSALCGARMIFVHSKVSIFDDHAGLVTSANLNGRSLRWDTELGVEINRPDAVQDLRRRVMGAWLPTDANESFTNSHHTAVGQWRALAERNAATTPRSRQGFVLPHPRRAAKRFGKPLPGVPAEMV